MSDDRLVAKNTGFITAGDMKRATKAAKSTMPCTLDDIRVALRIAEGNLTKAAELLDISRPLLFRKITLNPVLQRVLDDLKQRKIDKLEDLLMEQAEQGNVTAITFGLRTLGKERGYTEKATVEHELGPNAVSSAAAMIEALRRREREQAQLALPEPNTIDVTPEKIEDAAWEEAKAEQ